MSSRSRHSRRTLPTQRSACAFAVWRLHGCADHGDPFALEDMVEGAAELGVAIVDQQAQRLLPIVDRHQQVERLLGCPGAGRGRGAGDELDSAALERDEEEHVDSFQPGGLDGEEIAGERRRRVLTEEVAPGELVSLRRRRQTMADEDRPHRCRRNRDAKASQFADDPSVAPRRVLACELNDERPYPTIERRPPRRPSVRIRPSPLTSSRCQRRTVAGRTDKLDQARRGSAPASAARIARSKGRTSARRGCRRRITSSCRSNRISSSLERSDLHSSATNCSSRQNPR
jgi:hypothetical protein